MPPEPPRGSGLRPSVLQGTCLLTSQCPSTSKVNENPGIVRDTFLFLGDLFKDYKKRIENQR